MMKKVIYPLQKIHGDLFERKKIRQKIKAQRLEIQGVASESLVILGTPTHSNIGDSAIVLAETAFLRRCLSQGKQVEEITAEALSRHVDLTTKKILEEKHALVCWHGGGNMGDLWFFEEELRRSVFSALKGHPLLVLPQTIYYSDTEKGRQEACKSVPFYNGNPELKLTAREKQSFLIMKELYPDADVLLTPDIVLSSTADLYGVVSETRRGVLLCLRCDLEKVVSDENWKYLENVINKMGKAHRRTDMYSDGIVTKENRNDCVRKKMQEFCGAELVITDRLHGMVFAALTGTPCIAFSNNNHKVKGTYDWIHYLPYIKYAETIEEAEHFIPELLTMRNCQFDNSPLMPYFETLEKVVIEACQ